MILTLHRFGSSDFFLRFRTVMVEATFSTLICFRNFLRDLHRIASLKAEALNLDLLYLLHLLRRPQNGSRKLSCVPKSQLHTLGSQCTSSQSMRGTVFGLPETESIRRTKGQTNVAPCRGREIAV